MKSQMIRSYEDLIQTADAYENSRTLVTGVELGVFTHLSGRPQTAEEIARKTRTSPEGMGLLLNALAGMGLLHKSANRFRNSRLSRTYLDAAGPRSITHFLWLAGQHWEDWLQLTPAIRKGRGTTPPPPIDDPAFRRRFATALHERSRYLIPKITRHISLKGTRSLLDLGGGAGSYAFALLRKTPGLHATIFDRPVAVKVARAEARREGLAKRVSVIGGDLFEQDYGGPYDTVFYSNVLHIYGPKENLQILKKVKRALRPGGRLIIIEYFLERDRTRPLDASLFNLMMYLFTPSGSCYTWDEVTRWLRRIGFSGFRRVRITDKIGLLEGSRL